MYSYVNVSIGLIHKSLADLIMLIAITCFVSLVYSECFKAFPTFSHIRIKYASFLYVELNICPNNILLIKCKLKICGYLRGCTINLFYCCNPKRLLKCSSFQYITHIKCGKYPKFIWHTVSSK